MLKYLPLIILLLCAFKAHDGDTLTKVSFRMAYIDAPELKQTCHISGREVAIGKMSQQYLQRISYKKLAGCRILEVDKYGRAVVDCGYNLAMVREGMAVCYDKYMTLDEQKKCHTEQDYAEDNDLGLWQCEDFVQPSDFRHRKR